MRTIELRAPVPGRARTFLHPRRRSTSRRRWVRWVVLGGLAALVALGGLSILPVLSVRADFEAARSMLERGRERLLAGDLAGAEEDFAAALTAFRGAREGPGGILLRLEGLIPVLGRTPGALIDLADVGQRISWAGLAVTRGLARLPDGLASLGPSEGRIPIEHLASLEPAARFARSSLEEAGRIARALPESWVPGPVAEARDLVRAELERVLPVARSADSLTQSLPRFAGSDRPRRYFVAAQNSAELRGTGGLIGNYAILTIDRGQISLGPFRDVQTLPNLPPEAVEAPSEEFRDLYDPFGGAGFWLNLNMTPDVPTAAGLIEALYERVAGTPLDGTILFDLQAMAALLEATGPVTVPDLGVTLTEDNVIDYVSAAGYLQGDLTNAFEDGPRLVAGSIWSRFLATSDAEATLTALGSAAADGHLALHAADRDLQAAFRLAGVSGGFGAEEGDFVGVALSNAGANKVDYYLGQEVRHRVRLEPGGVARATTTVTLANDAPAGIGGSYALGPSEAARGAGLHLRPGDTRWWGTLYCPAACRLTGASTEGAPAALEAHTERDHTVFAGFLEAEAGSATTLAVDTERAAAWTGDAAAGSYRLRLQGQPLIRPGRAVVELEAPPGTSISWTNVPMEVQGGSAVWRGTLGPPQDLEIRFQRGFLGRVWTKVWGFLTRPAIRL